MEQLTMLLIQSVYNDKQSIFSVFNHDIIYNIFNYWFHIQRQERIHSALESGDYHLFKHDEEDESYLVWNYSRSRFFINKSQGINDISYYKSQIDYRVKDDWINVWYKDDKVNVEKSLLEDKPTIQRRLQTIEKRVSNITLSRLALFSYKSCLLLWVLSFLYFISYDCPSFDLYEMKQEEWSYNPKQLLIHPIRGFAILLMHHMMVTTRLMAFNMLGFKDVCNDPTLNKHYGHIERI